MWVLASGRAEESGAGAAEGQDSTRDLASGFSPLARGRGSFRFAAEGRVAPFLT